MKTLTKGVLSYASDNLFFCTKNCLELIEGKLTVKKADTIK